MKRILTTTTVLIALALLAAGCSKRGSSASRPGPGPQPPTAPDALTVEALSDTEIDLDWADLSDDEIGFQIERGTDGLTWTLIATLGEDETIFEDTGLTPLTTYFYRVRSFNTNGYSSYSNIDSDRTHSPSTTPPVAPSSLIAAGQLNSSSQINLSWTDNSDDETGFRIERRTGAGSFAEIATVGADTETYSDSGLTASTTYSYQVRAYNGAGTSPYSNSASATTGPANGATISALCANADTSACVLSNGAARCWGANGNGQIGDGTTNNTNLATAPSGISGVTAISQGGRHALALKSDGTVMAWGWNAYGQLGDGSTTDRLQPVAVLNLTGITAVSAGWNFSLALRNDGTVFFFGANLFGTKGDGTTGSASPTSTPFLIPGFSGVTKIATGAHHALAVRSGALYGWGNNYEGQLGMNNGSRLDIPVPTLISIPGTITSASCGYLFSLAVTSDGKVWSTGKNDYGQLGDGTTTARNQFLSIDSLPPTASNVACGRQHGIAILTNGTAYAWGSNGGGQMGDGTKGTNRLTPAQVTGLPGNVLSAAGGSNHSLFLLDTNRIYACGQNTVTSGVTVINLGQLGDGTWVERLTPVQTVNVP